MGVEKPDRYAMQDVDGARSLRQPEVHDEAIDLHGVEVFAPGADALDRQVGGALAVGLDGRGQAGKFSKGLVKPARQFNLFRGVSVCAVEAGSILVAPKPDGGSGNSAVTSEGGAVTVALCLP